MTLFKKTTILPFVLLSVIIILISLAGMRFFFLKDDDFSNQTVAESPSLETPGESSEPAETPAPLKQEEENAEILEPAEIVVNDIVAKGDTAGKILQPYLSAAEIQAMADVCADVFPLRRLRVGRPYAITIKDDSLLNFTYEMDDDKVLIVDYAGDKFSAKLEDIVYDVDVNRIQGRITANLFKAMDDAGESAALAIAMANIFAWEINFIRDLRPQDSFTLLVEKRYRNGELKGYGKVLAASFINQDSVYEAFLFKDAEGFPHYYTSKGESVKRAFLKAPLSFTRISSTFSPKRLHPILKVWRAHPGIDYAAPKGTPVKAVANGVVTFRGWGKGAGNYIALRHKNNFETMYLHLSKFAHGLVKGKRVQQGEVIGFVGSTGYSTGPHLDFRMKKDGVYVNPIKMASPRTEPVGEKDFPEFSRLATTMREYMEGKREMDGINFYDAGKHGGYEKNQ